MKLNLAIKNWKNLFLLLVLIFVVGLGYMWSSNANDLNKKKSEKLIDIEKVRTTECRK